jgi:hypothetical protein
VLELVHVPPGSVLVKVTVEPTQTLEAPDMADGEVLTVTTAVR